MFPRFDRTESWILAALSALCLLLGAAYISRIPLGLPYDEPAHFHNVLDYAKWQGLPVMRPGGSYEAYQAPLYYLLTGVFAKLSAGIFSPLALAYWLRALSLLAMLPVIALSLALARSAAPGSRVLPILTATFIGLNPSLLAIAASIQNDALAIGFSLWAIWIASQELETSSSLSWKRALYLGMVIALAVLSKLTALFLVIALPFFLLWAHRNNGRKALRFVIVCGAAVVMLTFWWFVRNKLLYHDWTGSSVVNTLYHPPTEARLNLLDSGSIFNRARSILTYLWIPVEYHRSELQTPLWMRAALISATALSFFGWGCKLFWNNSRKRVSSHQLNVKTSQLIGFCYFVCLAAYLWICTSQWVLPARIILPSIIAPALFLCGGWLALKIHPRIVIGSSVALLLVFNIYFLFEVKKIPQRAYMQTFFSIHE